MAELIATESYQGEGFEHNRPPAIMRKMCELLKSEGHECAMIIGMKNYTFKWCEKDECVTKKMYEDMRKRQEKQDNFLAKLRSEGHKCITILESYPVQISWCRKDQCVRA